MSPRLFYRENTFEELFHKGRDVENILRNAWIQHRDGGDMVRSLVIARSVCAGIVKEIDEIFAEAKVTESEIKAVDTFRPNHTVDLS